MVDNAPAFGCSPRHLQTVPPSVLLTVGHSTRVFRTAEDARARNNYRWEGWDWGFHRTEQHWVGYS
jgi:hypothetical protein